METPVSQVDITPAITELRHAIEALPESIRQPVATQSADPMRRETATTDSAALDRLTAAVTELNGLLRAGTTAGADGRTVGSRSLSAWKSPGYPSLAALQQKLDANRQADGQGWFNLTGPELARAHVLWTREDLLERYGTPVSVRASGQAHELWLGYEGIPSPTGRWTIFFIVAEGFVGSVRLEHNAQ